MIEENDVSENGQESPEEAEKEALESRARDEAEAESPEKERIVNTADLVDEENRQAERAAERQDERQAEREADRGE
ncbi:MAG: hypothetical protein ABWY25_01275 [Paenisporosarcina sp.]